MIYLKVNSLGMRLIVDEVSEKFHSIAHQDSHRHGAHSHSHPTHGHGDSPSDDQHWEGHTEKSLKEIVPHISGLSIEKLEEAFNTTGLLDQVVAKANFTAMKDEIEFSFVLASGRKV